jgi:hypothetical protein
MTILTESTLNNLKRAWVKSIYNWNQFQDQEDRIYEIDFWNVFSLCYYEEYYIPSAYTTFQERTTEAKEIIIFVAYFMKQNSIREKSMRAIRELPLLE